MAGIFINYRTGDGQWAPELIDERLVQIFGEGRVFRDRRSMRPGTDFPPHLRRELQQCTVLLALIGRHWLTVRDEKTGARRIDVPGDYVHDEIEEAINLNKVIIPVLLDTTLPGADRLPRSLARLNDRQALNMREGYTHHDLDILVTELREYVPAVRAGRDTEQSARHSGNSGSVFDMGNGNTFDIRRSAFGINPTYNEAGSRRNPGDPA
ncbi:toll/interleukin-1 receptor domain-containing protein [Streptomyces sp. NPDC101249]|uniref:toll/interleukin-1 receptor domain-containing protein n=1 Tax=Streptomyces sp. NPDC101249 TaxID=3366140 RepID=UPI0038026119